MIFSLTFLLFKSVPLNWKHPFLFREFQGKKGGTVKIIIIVQTYLYIADSSNLHGNEPMSFFFTGNHFLVYSTPKQTRKLPVFRLPMMPCVRLFPLSPPFSVLYLRSALLVLVKFFRPLSIVSNKTKKKENFTGPSGDFHRRECSRLN